MTAREELTRIIGDALGAANNGNLNKFVADQILAAGYSKPRTITTAEERATLLPGTVCMDLSGNAWKRGTGSWVSTGGDMGALYDDEDLTLTVLHEPEGRK